MFRQCQLTCQNRYDECQTVRSAVKFLSNGMRMTASADKKMMTGRIGICNQRSCLLQRILLSFLNFFLQSRCLWQRFHDTFSNASLFCFLSCCFHYLTKETKTEDVLSPQFVSYNIYLSFLKEKRTDRLFFFYQEPC